MSLYVAASSASPGPADAAAALALLEADGISRGQLGPGLPVGRSWSAAAARWEGRLLLHHACLEPPLAQGGSTNRWNLAAGDETLRREAVHKSCETMRRAADLGAPFYSVHPGYSLVGSLNLKGVQLGAREPRERALDRLCRSLDRLAVMADALGIGLLLENMAGEKGSPALWQTPDEITQTLNRLAAPPVGLMFDVGHWLITCQARGWEPEPGIADLLRWVRAIAVHGNDGLEDLHQAPVADGIALKLARLAGGLAVPVVLEVRNTGRDELARAIALTEEVLAASRSQAVPVPPGS